MTLTLIAQSRHRNASRPQTIRRGPAAAQRQAPIGQHLLQRKEGQCACGGGCPRCQNTQPIQTKLAVSQPGDALEQEADQIADQVLRMPQSDQIDDGDTRNTNPSHTSCVTTSTRESQQDLGPLQNVLNSPGTPLDRQTRAFFEPRFGRDFSRIRLHDDVVADASARSLGARAYTTGEHIVFRRGEYSPQSESGRCLLAHELTHVVQQKATAPPMLMRSSNSSSSGGGSKPQTGLSGCHVFLGGRPIDHWLAGALKFGHLYIDVYEDASNYALIEGGPIGSTTSGTSGAWVKNSGWDARGFQWEITLPSGCPSFISCLKRKTADYHDAAHPYHYENGPNSNSFVWWVLNKCGLNLLFSWSRWPYLGYDYWKGGRKG